ncbi:MAG: sigma 54-interacting transcriptional regulator [Pseudomonadota bacterium]
MPKQLEHGVSPVALLDESGGDCGLGEALERSGLPWLRIAGRDQLAAVTRRRGIGVVLARTAAGEHGELLEGLRRAAPMLPVVLAGPVDDPSLVVGAIRGGAADYLHDRVGSAELAARLAAFVDARDDAPVCESDAARQGFALAARVARTDVSVLISGESGTGKEVVARFIHDRSERAAHPFVGVNCAAIPEHMMEALLFGHEKGAFTGAHQARGGKFEQADGGTLLLDEISEMNLELQAKLLRVLQEREVERIGANVSRTVDVRVLATSNRNLWEEVAAGRFREDLYYRISVFPLHLEPLRERIEDILPLAQAFVRKHGARMGRVDLALSPASRRQLVEHRWPGNVRELENAIQRALVLADDGVIEPGHLRLERAVSGGAPSPVPALGAGLESRVRNEEENAIAQALASSNGRRKDAARVLGISERTLRYKLQRLREREEVVT